MLATPSDLSSIYPAEERLNLERSVLRLTLRRAKLRRHEVEQRRDTFWFQTDKYQEDEDLRQAAQEQLWAQQRAMREQASLQPLSTCVAELRRWQGVQRAAHEHKCSQLRGRRNAEEGDLQWRIFCARLAHDSCGALCVVPLTPEQIRYCDSAASQQLQPRSKAKDPKIFTVVRGAAIIAARPSMVGNGGPASARSTRGLVCGDLCQTRLHLERLLSRLQSSVLASDGATTASLSQATVPAASGAACAASPGNAGGRRSAGASRPQTAGSGSGRSGSTNKSERVTSATDGIDSSPHVAPPAPLGKRLPLFPLSMRLSSDCLGWLHAKEGTAVDPHLYYLVEEVDATTTGRHAHRGGNSVVSRALAEKISSFNEVTAVSDVGVDLRLVLPEGLAESSMRRKTLHLRPAAIEHLLAVDCLWPGVDVADREVLSSCYTPRFSTHASRLTTLYAPLCDGPQADAFDGTGVARRLRPLRPPELTELLRVYVVREPQPTAAILALPIAASTDEKLSASGDDEALHHLYCSLTSPTASSTMQCNLLQLQPAVPATDEASSAEESVPQPVLVEMCQNGSLQAALSERSGTRLRNSSLTPPALSCRTLEAALTSAQKTTGIVADLTARAAREANPAEPAERVNSSPGRHPRANASPGR